MKTTITIILLLTGLIIKGQNLVSNPDFELNTSCPMDIPHFPVSNWTWATIPSTTDYFHTCGGQYTSIPLNIAGYQYSQSGNAYIGLVTNNFNGSDWREYAQSTFANPLESGCYEIELRYSLADSCSASNNIGVAITNGPPTDMFMITPQLNVSVIKPDRTIWHTETVNFQTSGGETTITIGNFYDNADTDFVYYPGRPWSHTAYYFIDYVRVEKIGPYEENVVPNLGPNLYVCENDFPIILSSNLPNATNVWSTGQLSSNIAVSEPGLYTIQTIDNCSIGFDTIEIFIIPEPQFTLNDTIICAGTPMIVQLDPALGTYTLPDGTNGTQYTINQPGAYNFVLDYGCTVIKEVMVIDDSVPTLSLPDTLKLCFGDTLQVEAVLDSINNANFIWHHGPLENSIEIYEEGVFYVEVSNNCGIENDSVTVIEEWLPILDVDSLTQICPGDTAKFIVESGTANIVWSTGVQGTELEIGFADVFWVELSNGCTTIRDSFEVRLKPELPSIDLGPDLDLCVGDSLVIGDASIFGDPIWNTGTYSNLITIYEAGEYSILNANSCNEVGDTILIADLGLGPTVSLGENISICLGDTINITAVGDYNEITWGNGSNSNIEKIAAAGSYYVTVTNDCGISYDTLIVTLNPDPPQVDLGIDQFFCQGDSVLLDVGDVQGVVSWSNNNSDSSSIYIYEYGEIIVTVSSTCGFASDSINVELLEALPELQLPEDTVLCLGEVLDISLSIPVSVDILWDDGSISPNKTISQPGSYWVEISNNCGNQIDSINVSYLSELANFSLPADTTICNSENYTILTNLLNDQIDYLWSDGSTADSLLVTQSGTYELQISNSCESLTEVVEILLIDSVSSFSFETFDTICFNEILTLDGNQGTQFEYLWQDGSTNTFYQITQSGSYTLEVSNSCNFETSTIEVTVLPEISFNFDLETEYSICPDEGVHIEIPSDISIQTIWNDGSVESGKFITEAGNYDVRVFNDCQDSLFKFIVDYKYCTNLEIYVPNIFSPNQDGINEFFTLGFPEDWDILSAQVRVFSRWGELVFDSRDPYFTWDGTFKGEPLNPGIFVYTIELETIINKENITISRFGDITIIK